MEEQEQSPKEVRRDVALESTTDSIKNPQEDPNNTPTYDARIENTTDTSQEEGMSLLQHLQELRYRLGAILVILVVGMFITYPFAEQIFSFIVHPLIMQLPAGKKLIFTALPEAFFVYLKLAFLASVFLTSPLTLYQLWAFIAPGLFKEERFYLAIIVFSSTLCLVGGAAFCYYQVFPIAFKFFLGFESNLVEALPSLSLSLDFAIKLLLAFSLIAQMPLFAFFLGCIGILKVALLRKWRKYFVLVAFIVAAILTPPDIFSQLLMAVPMLVLYEISIVIVFFCERAKKKKTQQEEKTC